MRIRIEVLDAGGAVRSEASGEDEAVLVHAAEYAEGDQIRIETGMPGAHLFAGLDDAVLPAQVYLAGTRLTLPVPVGDARRVFSPRAFSGAPHRIFARRAEPGEVSAIRNLALNPFDFAASTGVFPHCDANVTTRNEAVFAPRNAIDGEKANAGHGKWPYTSWGINRDPAAALTLSFGRPVLAQALTLYLRADFPHDAWWTSADAVFSDGQTRTLDLTKTGGAQRFAFDERPIEWVRLERLIKGDDPSPFPALTQIEVWGRDVPA